MQSQLPPTLFFDFPPLNHCCLHALTTHKFHHSPRPRSASLGGVHAFLRVQHLGCRMLFIRFVNRAIQAVRRSRPRRAAQARDSGHSPFRGPARGRSPRARISSVCSPQHAGCNASANPSRSDAAITAQASIAAVASRHRSRRGSQSRLPTSDAGRLRACAPPQRSRNMLDRLAIRRPLARKTDHFLTHSRRLATATHSASRMATSPCLLMHPS